MTEATINSHSNLDAEIDARERFEIARDEFFETIADGDLYFLLKGDRGGIGPRLPSDVASVMRSGVQPRDMLLDEWIVARELHWMHAEPGAAKTWLGLWMACRLIEAGKRVLWTDEELGVETVSERLLELGADPELVRKNFLYFPYPGWVAEDEDVSRWNELMRVARPALVVIDTATDAIAEADLDENSGVDVTRWVKCFCEPARRAGAAVLVLDHVVKGGTSVARGYAVGSRAKKAKAKVMYELQVREPFHRSKVGRVRVALVKNGVGGAIPERRVIRIGGELNPSDDTTRFVLDVTTQAPVSDGPSADLSRRVAEAVRTHGPDVSTQMVKDNVIGGSKLVGDALKELAASSDSPIESRKDGRSTLYSWIERPK